MIATFAQIYEAVAAWAAEHGIEVSDSSLPQGQAGEFEGVIVSMNRTYKPEERAYYLCHALGSIVLWSIGRPVQAMFDRLREANENKQKDSAALERAIADYRAFEIESSELAIGLLGELGFPEAIGPYSNFMRADLESMTEFHRRGHAPVWRTFFSRWNEEVRRGDRQVEPFRAKPIPPFRPLRIERQEILQRQETSG
jgi:hypothetical protein